MGRALLQSERNATLFVDVLRSYAREGKFKVHDFVVMPDHVHLLITLSDQLTIEQAMQLIKGDFLIVSRRNMGIPVKFGSVDFGSCGSDQDSFARHREYIAQNPVRKGLVDTPDEFPFCFNYLARRKAPGAKAP
jgi:putative transposase